MNLSIIVPCYNEEERLNIEDFSAYIEQSENINFCFVNDGSQDGTIKVLNSFCEKYPDRVSVLDLEINAGKAEAVRRGVELQSSLPHVDWVAFWDADLATPLAEVDRFVLLAEKHSQLKCITGCRFKHLGSDIRRKMSRHYIGRCFATIVSIILGIPVYDTQCGAKMFKTSLARKIFAEKFVSKWLFDVELFFRMRPYIKLTEIYELPLTRWDDVDGSRLKKIDFLKSPFVLLRIFYKYRNKDN
ncbi:MAG: glycosyltransferase [Bacteriovoracaceae bacterium]|nr:glycosyltransferase [Bacteriovoracaceae bacterium]